MKKNIKKKKEKNLFFSSITNKKIWKLLSCIINHITSGYPKIQATFLKSLKPTFTSNQNA